MTPEDKALYLQTRIDNSECVGRTTKPLFWLSGAKLSPGQIKMLRNHKLKDWDFANLKIVYEI